MPKYFEIICNSSDVASAYLKSFEGNYTQRNKPVPLRCEEAYGNIVIEEKEMLRTVTESFGVWIKNKTKLMGFYLKSEKQSDGSFLYFFGDDIEIKIHSYVEHVIGDGYGSKINGDLSNYELKGYHEGALPVCYVSFSVDTLEDLSIGFRKLGFEGYLRRRSNHANIAMYGLDKISDSNYDQREGFPCPPDWSVR